MPENPTEFFPSAETRLRSLLDAIEDRAVFSTDAAGKILDWSAGATQLLGPVPESLSSLLKIEDPIPSSEDSVYPLRSGGEVQLKKRNLPGGVTAWVATLPDEPSSDEAIERLRTVSDALPGLVSYVDRDLVFRYANDTYLRWFGVPLSEIVGCSVAEILGPTAFPVVRPLLERAFAGETVTYERTMPYIKGTREVQGTLTPDFDRDGSVKGVVTLVNDVTQLRRAEAEMRARESLWLTATESMQEAVLVLDAQGRVVGANAALYALHGATESEMLFKDFGGAVLDLDARTLDGSPVAREEFPAARALRGETVRELTLRVTNRRTGRSYVGGYGAAPLLDGGRLVGAVVTVHDLTRFHEAQGALAASERRYRSLALSTGAIVWNADAQMRLIEGPPALAEMTGQPTDSLAGTGWLDSIHPEDRIHARLDLGRALERQRASHTTFRVRRADGVYRLCFTRAVPVMDDAGHVVEWVGTTVDVQDETEAREALRRSEASLRRLIDTADEGIMRASADDRIVFGNERFWAMLGYDPGELDGRPLYDIFFPEDHVAARQRRLARRAGQGERYETRLRGKDDREVWVLGTVSVVMEAEQYQGTFTMFADITSRRAAEEALRQSENQYRQIAEGLPQLVWSTRADGYFDYGNGRWYGYTGTHPGETDGDGWAMTVHPEDMERTALRWHESLRTGSLYEVEYRLRGGDGEYRWFLGRALPIRDDRGEIVRWFGTCTDIQDQKALEEELERRVAERTRDLEGFMYTVSHDLRAPLRAISMTSSILLDEAGDRLNDEERETLVRQSRNAKRLGVLIDELLQMARLAGQEMRQEPVNLSELASEVVSEFPTTGVEFAIEPDLHANGDARMLKFLLQNLLGNAQKFSPQGGTVRLGRDGETFFVRDQGVGFDMAYAHQLFEPFTRLVTESQFPGTGIGLTNVKRIVERHGGRVWPESAPGQGATFWFTLA